MTPLQLAALGGMVIGLGVVLGAYALRPAPPRLSSAMALLSTQPRQDVVVAAPRPWLPEPLARFVDNHLGVREEDLAITDWTRSRLAARKAALALYGLLLPAVFTAMLAIVGSTPPLAFPAAL